MNIKEFQPSDYEMVCSWWIEQDWPSIPLEALPLNGYIVNNICAGFLYLTDSSIAIMEFIIADPKSDKNERKECLDILIDSLLDRAKFLGYKSVLSMVKHPSLINKYKSHGFLETDSNMTHFVRSI